MIEIIIPICAIGICLAIITGFIGPFIVWRRMAYFSDSLSHSALLGVAMGVLLNINPSIFIAFFAMGFALILTILKHTKILAIDSLLGILAHFCLAAGIIIFSILQLPQNILYQSLFGDILSADWVDVFSFAVLAIVVVCLITKFFHQLLLITINEDYAKSEGINTNLYAVATLVILSIVITIATKIVGILLISAMIIIPAAAARLLAKSPWSMVIIACIVGFIAVLGGISMSFFYDYPTGPAIIIGAFSIFTIMAFARIIASKINIL